MIPLATWPRSPDDDKYLENEFSFFAKVETVVVLPEDGALFHSNEVRICWGGTRLSIETLKNA